MVTLEVKRLNPCWMQDPSSRISKDILESGRLTLRVIKGLDKWLSPITLRFHENNGTQNSAYEFDHYQKPLFKGVVFDFLDLKFYSLNHRLFYFVLEEYKQILNKENLILNSKLE